MHGHSSDRGGSTILNDNFSTKQTVPGVKFILDKEKEEEVRGKGNVCSEGGPVTTAPTTVTQGQGPDRGKITDSPKLTRPKRGHPGTLIIAKKNKTRKR